MSSWQNNIASTDDFLAPVMYLAKILFECFKAYHFIISKQEMEEALVLLTLDIASYDLPGHSVKIRERPLHIRIRDKESDSIYGILK